jgi:hypothetical protein
VASSCFAFSPPDVSDFSNEAIAFVWNGNLSSRASAFLIAVLLVSVSIVTKASASPGTIPAAPPAEPPPPLPEPPQPAATTSRTARR